MNSAINFRCVDGFSFAWDWMCMSVCGVCMRALNAYMYGYGINTEYERCVRTNASYDLCVLTSEYELSVPRITTSIGDVWLATQKPTPFGRFLVSWNLMTADSGRAIMRNPTLNTMSLKYRRIFRSGISPISENEMIARLAYCNIHAEIINAENVEKNCFMYFFSFKFLIKFDEKSWSYSHTKTSNLKNVIIVVCDLFEMGI